MTEKVDKTQDGAIIYDPQVIREIGPERFTQAGWLHAEPLAGAPGAGGRGSTLYVGNVPRQFVLRHYLRGGLVGRLVRDRYVYTGEDSTRPFREWRLLAKLAARGLNVPRPAAARFRRRGPFYTADIITVRIPGVRPLSAAVTGERRDAAFWSGIGRALRAFHAEGVFHADMNAYNVQVDEQDRVWLLDFDRGRLRPAGPWQQRTLARLERSLVKIRGLDPQVNFTRENWEQLLAGYFEASRSA
ncbi:MAG: 3-deoxy-D-manno-octulosonic acid kinase [Woeseiaceae bacterium]|nr:3-deoxy-D-manno-octulosonic acid kinase [Woeseiaceae bacterium]